MKNNRVGYVIDDLSEWVFQLLYLKKFRDDV